MNITECKSEYVAAMRRLKTIAESRVWCCEEHADETHARIRRASNVKNMALEAYRDGTMDEQSFIRFIAVGTVVVNALADAIESSVPDAAGAAVEAQINAPHGYA